ncbi:MAG TPA: hypothetical protein VGR55_18385 [Candidatus Acidoferrum sp.]|nr:hypothetical protein [Candidatus Acidoferrum sp.]
MRLSLLPLKLAQEIKAQILEFRGLRVAGRLDDRVNQPSDSP